MTSNACGIDFGTSNSAISTYSNGSLKLIDLEQEKPTIPSAVFFNTDEDEITFGRQGICDYLEGYSGRLMRSLKSVLGSSLANERTQIGNRVYNYTDIIALVISHIKQIAEQTIGAPLDSVVMGRPVHFVDNNADADKRAEQSLRDILAKQNFKNISFEFEPIAAAKDYETTLTKEELVLVFDIGGGTSDFSLIRLCHNRRGKQDRTNDILANSGLRMGGTDFDRRLSLHAIMPEMGYKTAQLGKLTMPAHPFQNLATWQRGT